MRPTTHEIDMDILAALPLPTVLIGLSGSVEAASITFRQMADQTRTAGQPWPDAEMNTLLARVAAQAGPAGQLRVRHALGAFQLYWRRMEKAGFIVVCLAPPEAAAGYAVEDTEGTTITGGTRELPGPDQTLALLGRAIAACRSTGASLALTRLHCQPEGTSAPLHSTEHELWRNLGRKLRATCRMSDLVGVTKEGDFLIILLGANLLDTQAVTHRVLGQLQSWLRQNVPMTIGISAGYAIWESGSGDVTPAALIAQTGEELSSEVP